MPRSGIAESYCYFYFWFFEDLPYLFQSGYTGLHHHQQYTRIFFLHILANISVICCLFDDRKPSSQVWGDLLLWFWFPLPWKYWLLLMHLFHVLVGHLCVFGKCLFEILKMSVQILTFHCLLLTVKKCDLFNVLTVNPAIMLSSLIRCRRFL